MLYYSDLHNETLTLSAPCALSLAHNPDELNPSEIQRIVYHYFLYESDQIPQEYMPVIVYEILRRKPTTREIYYAQQFYRWIERSYIHLENYILDLTLIDGQSEHLCAEEILFSFEQQYRLKLDPRELWIPIVQRLLSFHSFY